MNHIGSNGRLEPSTMYDSTFEISPDEYVHSPVSDNRTLCYTFDTLLDDDRINNLYPLLESSPTLFDVFGSPETCDLMNLRSSSNINKLRY